MIDDPIKTFLSRFIIVLMFILPAISSYAQVSEYEYKAAFIERFTRFVEWPAEIENNNFDSIFKITIFGENPFGTALDELFAEVTIKRQSVKINYTENIDEIAKANLVFISSSERKKIKQILSFIDKEPILIIGDTKRFCEMGTHINMYIDGNYIKYEINKEAIEKAGLTISSLLLTSAKIVKTDE